MNADERRLNEVAEQIIGCCYRVANTLGAGFLEKVYENALVIELRMSGLRCDPQHPVPDHYRGQRVGDYVADILVEGCVIVEIKAVKALDDVHTAQCLNYLRAIGLKVCLLVNFARPSIDVKRLVNRF